MEERGEIRELLIFAPEPNCGWTRKERRERESEGEMPPDVGCIAVLGHAGSSTIGLNHRDEVHSQFVFSMV